MLKIKNKTDFMIKPLLALIADPLFIGEVISIPMLTFILIFNILMRNNRESQTFNKETINLFAQELNFRKEAENFKKIARTILNK